jgi:hypothetical protein
MPRARDRKRHPPRDRMRGAANRGPRAFTGWARTWPSVVFRHAGRPCAPPLPPAGTAEPQPLDGAVTPGAENVGAPTAFITTKVGVTAATVHATAPRKALALACARRLRRDQQRVSASPGTTTRSPIVHANWSESRPRPSGPRCSHRTPTRTERELRFHLANTVSIRTQRASGTSIALSLHVMAAGCGACAQISAREAARRTTEQSRRLPTRRLEQAGSLGCPWRDARHAAAIA